MFVLLFVPREFEIGEHNNQARVIRVHGVSIKLFKCVDMEWFIDDWLYYYLWKFLLKP